jgi:hypothetical protein
MARKVVNRKVLREQAEAAEAAGGAPDAEKAEKKVKKPTKRKSKSKDPEQIRMKLFWGVYNQSMKLVAKYDFTHKKAADQKAAELSAPGKNQHFVQKIKETIQE